MRRKTASTCGLQHKKKLYFEKMKDSFGPYKLEVAIFKMLSMYSKCRLKILYDVGLM